MLGDKAVILFGEIKEHILFCTFGICGCAAVMSIMGASIESKIQVGVTALDRTLAKSSAGEVPLLTGILPMASEQNMWLNFRYALIGAVAGFVIVMIIMVIVTVHKGRKKHEDSYGQ